MKFTVSCSQLTTLLQHIARALPKGKGPSTPVLSQFLIEIKNGTLRATASDKVIRISGSVELVDSEGDKSFTVAPDNILEYVRALPEQPLLCEITQEENYEKMTITHEGGFSEFAVADAALYPAGFGDETNTSSSETTPRRLVTATERLLAGIVATSPTISEDLNRPILSGIYFDVKEDCLVLVSTDSRVLTKFTDKEADLTAPLDPKGRYHSVNGFSLPKVASDLLRGVLPPFIDTETEIEYTNSKARFTFGTYELTSLLNTGTFPNYDPVIPISNPFKVIIDKEQTITALRRIGRSFDSSSLVIALLEFREQTIDLTSHNIDLSVKSEERIQASIPEELVGMRIGFDGKTFSTLLSVCPTPEVELRLADQTRNVLITSPEELPATEIQSIIMPLKIVGDL